jgi:hypothetical protein
LFLSPVRAIPPGEKATFVTTKYRAELEITFRFRFWIY